MAHRIPQNLTRSDILAAVSEADRAGIETFLQRHGYAMAKRWQLRVGGQSYPSKAILGVAAGLRSSEFSGGAAHSVRVLRSLGFEVRDGRRIGLSRRLRGALGSLLLRFRFPRYQAPQLPVDPVASFASGSNNPGDIRGMAVVGHDVGVAFPELREPAMRELEALAGSDIQVFVDSGAFSEVAFTAAGPVIVKPLGADHWDRLLACYKRLATVLGDQLHVVAPDMVGHQAETLERLARYAPALAEIAELGARILVPMQLGAVSQAAFAAQVNDVFALSSNLNGWIPALPCKKAATSIEQAAAFVAETQPSRIHLLGLGTTSRSAAAYLEAISDAAPLCMVQVDSCLMRRMVGRTGGAKRFAGGVRRATHALDLVRSIFGDGAEASADRKTVQVALALGAY